MYLYSYFLLISMIITEHLKLATQGNNEVINITDNIQNFIDKSKLKHGSVLVFVAHTTASVAILEDEEGHKEDLRNFFESISPKDYEYQKVLEFIFWTFGCSRCKEHSSILT